MLAVMLAVVARVLLPVFYYITMLENKYYAITHMYIYINMNSNCANQTYLKEEKTLT